MALLTGTVTGRFEDSTVGATEPYSGTITFTPEADYLLSDSSVVLPSPVKVIVMNSYFSVDLVATDDPTINPVDFTYRVDLNLKANGYPVKRQPFSISVPAGQVTDLATATPVASYAGTPTIVGPAGPAGGTLPLEVNTVNAIGVYTGQTFKWTKDVNNVMHIWGSFANTTGSNLTTTQNFMDDDARFKHFNGVDWTTAWSKNNASNTVNPNGFYVGYQGRLNLKLDAFSYNHGTSDKITFDVWYTAAN